MMHLWVNQLKQILRKIFGAVIARLELKQGPTKCSGSYNVGILSLHLYLYLSLPSELLVLSGCVITFFLDRAHTFNKEQIMPLCIHNSRTLSLFSTHLTLFTLRSCDITNYSLPLPYILYQNVTSLIGTFLLKPGMISVVCQPGRVCAYVSLFLVSLQSQTTSSGLLDSQAQPAARMPSGFNLRICNGLL